MRYLPVVVAALCAGCSSAHDFTLADIAALNIGESLRSEVDERLGKPEETGFALPHQLYHSTELIATPPMPLGFITWPVFWGASSEEYLVTARFTEQDVLSDLSLHVQGHSQAFILLLIQPHLLAPRLNRARLEELRGLEAKGVKVSIEAYFDKLSIAEYEKSFKMFADE